MKCCTYCNSHEANTKDHVLAKALQTSGSFGHNQNRPVIVPACKFCNNNSNEMLVTSVLSIFNTELREKVNEHLKGKNHLEEFLSLCRITNEKLYLYLDEPTIKPISKIMLGLRRFLLNEKWKHCYFSIQISALKSKKTYSIKGGKIIQRIRKIIHPLPISPNQEDSYAMKYEFNSLIENIELHQYRHFVFGINKEMDMVYLSYDKADGGEKLELVANFEELDICC